MTGRVALNGDLNGDNRLKTQDETNVLLAMGISSRLHFKSL